MNTETIDKGKIDEYYAPELKIPSSFDELQSKLTEINEKYDVYWVKEVKESEIDTVTVKAINLFRQYPNCEYIRTARTETGMLIDSQGFSPNKEDVEKLAIVLSKKVRLIHDSALCHNPWQMVWRNIYD